MVPSVYVKLRDIKNRSGWLLLSFTLYFCMNGSAKQFVFALASFLRAFRWADSRESFVNKDCFRYLFDLRVLTFHFENFSTWIWRLPFAICLKRDSKYQSIAYANLWSSGTILFYLISCWRVLSFISYDSLTDRSVTIGFNYIFSCLKMNLSSETVMCCFRF